MAYVRSTDYLKTAKDTPGYEAALENRDEAKREYQTAALAFKNHRAEHERGHRVLSKAATNTPSLYRL